MVALGLLLLVTFWSFVFLSPSASENQYIYIIGFLVLPGVLVSGLILCPLGMLIRRWRLKHFPPVHEISARAAVLFLIITFFLILPVLGVSGYKGYHYTESTEFCGSCHAVMEPQYVRYQQSPHARVTCAGCHIGPGASPFVKSKLSGMRQVFKTALETYPRPIPPAITELRPARDTCEQCHWPQQFFGSQLKTFARYASDEANTRHEYEILLKVGGANRELGQAEGIHMHMLDRVEYVAIDEKLDHIPWIRYTNPDGSQTVYRSDGKTAADPPPSAEIRRLDCIDCHNLSGHQFLAPGPALDHAINVGQIDDSLPFIKREAVRVLAEPYETKELALTRIAEALQSFYLQNYPAVWQERRQALERAVEAVRSIYTGNFYPYMKVNWQTYPNHIGHMDSPGCFRCHDGLHVNDQGKPITTDCMACHSFLTRQADSSIVVEGSFSHPMKLHDGWDGLGPHSRMLCTDCHDGGTRAWGTSQGLQATECGDCHESGRWEQMRKEIDLREAAARPSSRPASLPSFQNF